MQSICPGSFHGVGSGCSVHGNSWACGEPGRWQGRILSSSWSAGVLTKCDGVCSSDWGLQSLVSHFLLESQNCWIVVFLSNVWLRFQASLQKLCMRLRSENATEFGMGWTNFMDFGWYWKMSLKPLTGPVFPKWSLCDMEALDKLQSHLTDQSWISLQGPSAFWQHPLLPKWRVQLRLDQLPWNQESEKYLSLIRFSVPF